jgi:hypothetical protein
MLTKTNKDIRESELLDTLDDLDFAIRKAQLIHKIEVKSRESDHASPEELEKIKLELKAYREQIRMLDEG